MSNTGDIVKRTYRDFRGVDFRGGEVITSRSPDARNVWKDYSGAGRLSSRPVFKLLHQLNDRIYGIFFFGIDMVIHAGATVYVYKDSELRELISNANKAQSYGFEHGEDFYFFDSKNFYRVWEIGSWYSYEAVSGYAPTTTIGRDSSGGDGDVHEYANMLTGRRINTFYAAENDRTFHLDAEEIDSVDSVVVKINDITVEKETVNDDGRFANYTVDPQKGTVTLNNATTPVAEGDIVSIEFSKTIPGERSKILGCTIFHIFDNRLFAGGNPKYPNTFWHSALNDPTYFPDNNEYNLGFDNAPITAMVSGNDNLWVFRNVSGDSPSVFKLTPSLDAEYGKIYPSQSSAVSLGCLGTAVNFGDDIVFLSRRGAEGIGAIMGSENLLSHRSSLIDSKMIDSIYYRSARLAEWNGYLMIFSGKEVFLADSRAMFSNEGHAEYEWFYWTIDEIENLSEIYTVKEHEGKLYIGAPGGVYELSGEPSVEVQSYWITPRENFGAANKVKTTNKRGGILNAAGYLELYARADGGEWTLIDKGTVYDRLIIKAKLKKFGEVQFKVLSQARAGFTLDSLTIEGFVGGYIKK
jgi:hypothetical protein